MASLKQIYRTYIQAINDRDWPSVANLLNPTVTFHQKPHSAEEYITLLTQVTNPAPDLKYNIDILLADEDQQMIAVRLWIVGTPEQVFLGFQPNEHTLEFAQHVFYKFEGGKIKEIQGVIDMDEVRRQMALD